MLLRLDKTKIPCQNLISFEILGNKRNLSQNFCYNYHFNQAILEA